MMDPKWQIEILLFHSNLKLILLFSKSYLHITNVEESLSKEEFLTSLGFLEKYVFIDQEAEQSIHIFHNAFFPFALA